jgi:hypothetical protein
MDKPKHNPLTERKVPKKHTGTLFVQAAINPLAPKKLSTPVNQTEQPKIWTKKSDRSWEY